MAWKYCVFYGERIKRDNLIVKEGKVSLKLANKDKLGDKFIDLLKKQIKSMVPEAKSISIS